jgi:predicted dienelactone hydrolase
MKIQVRALATLHAYAAAPVAPTCGTAFTAAAKKRAAATFVVAVTTPPSAAPPG